MRALVGNIFLSHCVYGIQRLGSYIFKRESHQVLGYWFKVPYAFRDDH